jgi:hypothetical protein
MTYSEILRTILRSILRDTPYHTPRYNTSTGGSKKIQKKWKTARLGLHWRSQCCSQKIKKIKSLYFLLFCIGSRIKIHKKRISCLPKRPTSLSARVQIQHQQKNYTSLAPILRIAHIARAAEQAPQKTISTGVTGKVPSLLCPKRKVGCTPRITNQAQ